MSDPSVQTNYPTLDGTTSTSANTPAANASNSAASLKDTVVTNAQSAMNTVANHPITQNITSGPMAQKAQENIDKTSNEFSNVANSRVTPDQTTATGQSLTHYHSMFYNILSWENPRVTGISYAAIVSLIFFTRYVPVLKLVLKGTYIVLGIIAAAETAGKLVFNKGLATQVRPRKYYTFPRESLESATEDIEQLINFFVIELQRIVFAENIYVTIAAFAASLFGYLLVKFTPTWGVTLIFTTVVYFAPLIYISNKELIDEHLNNAGNVINEQSGQFRDLAAHHTNRASEMAKTTVNQYTNKAQEMMGQAKSKAAEPNAPNPANLNPVKDEPAREININKSDFPTAPSTEPTATGGVSTTEPLAQPGHPLPAQ